MCREVVRRAYILGSTLLRLILAKGLDIVGKWKMRLKAGFGSEQEEGWSDHQLRSEMLGLEAYFQLNTF